MKKPSDVITAEMLEKAFVKNEAELMRSRARYLPAVPAIYEARLVAAGEKDGTMVGSVAYLNFETVRHRGRPEDGPPAPAWDYVFTSRNPLSGAIARAFLEANLQRKIEPRQAADAYEAVWCRGELNGKLLLVETNLRYIYRAQTDSYAAMCCYRWLGLSDGVSELPALPMPSDMPPVELRVKPAWARSIVTAPKTSPSPPPPEKKRKHGDPGWRSPKQLDENNAYVRVDGSCRTTPGTEWVVFMHRGTETLWKTEYIVRLDDSDWAEPTGWEEVQPVKKTVTEYEPVKPG